jgi:hypothetical protein
LWRIIRKHDWNMQTLYANQIVFSNTSPHWILVELEFSNPPEPIKLFSQSIAGVRLWCAFYQPLHPVQKCWAKTILLSQAGMFWLFFLRILIDRVTYWAPLKSHNLH